MGQPQDERGEQRETMMTKTQRIWGWPCDSGYVACVEAGPDDNGSTWLQAIDDVYATPELAGQGHDGAKIVNLATTKRTVIFGE